MSEPFDAPVTREDIVARIQSHPLGDEPAAQRAAFDHRIRGRSSSGATQTNERIAARYGTEALGTIVYLHGGGYVFGSPQTHARIGEGLAERTGLCVPMPAYPLAPESVWPAQLDAMVAVVRSLSGPVVLAGDSAGGHLALVTALELARLGTPVAGLVLLSPNTDRSGLSDTRQQNDPLDPMVDDTGNRELACQCFGDMPSHHPQVSPVLDDLARLPPIFIEVGAEEVLFGDRLLLAGRARRAGKQVTLHIESQGLHMGQAWAPWWPVAIASLDRAAAFGRSVAAAP